MAILRHPEGCLRAVEKLLNSAVANAENNFNMDKNNLYVAECFVCPGPTSKGFDPERRPSIPGSEKNLHVTMVLKKGIS